MFAIPCFLQVLFWKLFFAAQQDFAKSLGTQVIKSARFHPQVVGERHGFSSATPSRHGWRLSRSGDRLDMIAWAPSNAEVGPVGTLYKGYKL